MNRRLLYILSIILFISVFSSCKNQRVERKKTIKLYGPDYVLKEMHHNQSAFEWFSGKATANFIQGKKKTSFTALIRMKSDSIIWISISSGIGIEGARLLLTQDSVKYINRIDKTYFVGDYKFLSSFINSKIDFSMIQALLTAKDFSWYDYQNLKVKLDNQLYQIESTNRHKLKKQSKMISFEHPVYYQSLWVNPETFKIEKVKIKKIGKENKKMFASYKQYKLINEQLIPYSLEIKLYNEKEMSLEILYHKIGLDKKVGFPFSISKKYSPIKL
ncbi:MAG: DUF4292 domain-containing protein [Bacteroidales bacterium]|nr:DUF4292 domain-containing protein [Bacteroidales bacterium]